MENTGLFVAIVMLTIIVGAPIICKLMSLMSRLSYSVDTMLMSNEDFYMTLSYLKRRYSKIFWKVNRTHLTVWVLSDHGWESWHEFELNAAKRAFLGAHGFFARSICDGLCYVANGFEDLFDYDEIFEKEESI